VGRSGSFAYMVFLLFPSSSLRTQLSTLLRLGWELYSGIRYVVCEQIFDVRPFWVAGGIFCAYFCFDITDVEPNDI